MNQNAEREMKQLQRRISYLYTRAAEAKRNYKPYYQQYLAKAQMERSCLQAVLRQHRGRDALQQYETMKYILQLYDIKFEGDAPRQEPSRTGRAWQTTRSDSPLYLLQAGVTQRHSRNSVAYQSAGAGQNALRTRPTSAQPVYTGRYPPRLFVIQNYEQKSSWREGPRNSFSGPSCADF